MVTVERVLSLLVLNRLGGSWQLRPLAGLLVGAAVKGGRGGRVMAD